MKRIISNNIIDKTIREVAQSSIRRKAGTWQGVDEFKDNTMRVLFNKFITIGIPSDVNELEQMVKPDAEWCYAHFAERVSGKPTNPGKAYKIWPYKTFRDGEDPYMDGKQFSHTYQERFWPKQAGRGDLNHSREELEYLKPQSGIRYDYGDLNDMINLLKKNPLTRQAYLPVFFPEDTGAVHGQRVPCTLGYYFWISSGYLHCNYTIRSCDVFRHFRNDVFLTALLMHYVAEKVNVKPGLLHFLGFNMHVFENDLYALRKKETKLGNKCRVDIR